MAGAQFFVGSLAQGFPLLIPASETPLLHGRQRNEISIWTPDAEGKSLKPVPFEFRELNERGGLVFRDPTYISKVRKQLGNLPEKESNLGALSWLHQYVLDENDLGDCLKDCQSWARQSLEKMCRDKAGILKKGYEMRVQKSQKVAFIANCPPTLAPARTPSAVVVDLKARTLTSKEIRYEFSEKNHMLLESFSLADKGEEKGKGKYIPMLKDSELHLYAKLKYFFPLHFTGNDVRSELVGYTQGSLVSAGELSFFLDVLSFKIRMNLLSEVSMFRDAIHVPVILTLPVSGSVLKPGSGVFYGFRYLGNDFWKDVQTDLPRLPKEGGAIPFAEQRTFLMRLGSTVVAVGIRMPEVFREMGFSPALASPEDLKAVDFPKTKSDFGIFYDITKLQKGTHKFEIWFYVGKVGEEERLLKMAREGIQIRVSELAWAQ